MNDPELERLFDAEFALLPNYAPDQCPVRNSLLALSDDKWKLPIVMKLGRYGRLRFRELLRALPHVRPKALTKALRSLDQHGFIGREVFNEVPTRVEYYLLNPTVALLPILFQVEAWALAQQMPTTRQTLHVVPELTYSNSAK
jgi:DNA-binding HxlR family transcriptional regulator